MVTTHSPSGLRRPQNRQRKGIARRVSYKLLGERLEWWRDRLWRRTIDFGRKKRWFLTPIDSLFRLLELRGGLPKPIVALELFGRHGLWKTVEYADRCSYLEHYEINRAHASFARLALPHDRTVVVCADSIAAVRDGTLQRRDYSFVFADSFCHCFGDDYCEYFDLFPGVFRYMGQYCVLVFNVFMDAPAPDSADSRHLERRRRFYGLSAPECDTPLTYEVMMAAHRAHVPSAEFDITDMFVVPHAGATVFLVMCLRRKTVRTPARYYPSMTDVESTPIRS